MKKNSILISLLLVLSIAFFSSCKKDDNVTPGEDHSKFTPKNHKASLNSATSDLIVELEAVQNTKTINAIKSISGIMEVSSPLGTGGLKVENLMNDILGFVENPGDNDDFVNSLKSGDDRFIYANYVGEYSWNASTESWDKSSSDKIIFNFPSEEGGAANNAVFTFENYADKQIPNDGKIIYVPVSASMNLVIDGNKEMEFILSSAFADNGIPVSIDLSLFVSPFTFTFQVYNSMNSISQDMRWFNSEGNILSFGTVINGDFSAIVGNSEPIKKVTTASAYVQMFDAKLTGEADVVELIKFDDPTLDQVNTYTTIELFWANDGVKIADGEFYRKPDVDEVSLMLNFTDGTSADAEVFFEGMAKQFADFFNKLIKDFE